MAKRKITINETAGAVLILLIIGISFFIFNQTQSKEVTWYGSPSKISMSGDFRFYLTNKDGSHYFDLIDARGELQGHYWFWAIPKDISAESVEIKQIFSILNKNNVYKITGTKDEDDCDYYVDTNLSGICVPSLTIHTITKVGVEFYCPEYYGKREYYYDGITSFIQFEKEQYPDIDLETLVAKRLKTIIENGCRQKPVDLRTWSEDIKEAYNDLYTTYKPTLSPNTQH